MNTKGFVRTFDANSSPILLLATVFTVNFLSMVFQVIWTRKIMVIFGTTALSISTILTVFLSGIALGGYLGSRWIKKAEKKYRFLGTVMIILGAYCLGATFLLGYIREPFFFLAGVVEHPTTVNLLKLFFSFVVLIVPTTIIGATFPIITYLYATDFKNFGKAVASIYFIDTLAAAAGALICGFLLVPWVGLRETSFIGAGIYFILGLIIISKKDGKPLKEEVPSQTLAMSVPVSSRTRFFILTALFLSGFAALVLEVAWSRYFHLLFGTSIYAFALVLAAFMLGLSIGSASIKRFLDRFRNPLIVFAFLEMAIAFFSLFAIYTNNWIEGLYFEYFFKTSNFYIFQVILFVTAFVMMLVPTSLMGANFPLAVKILGRNRETRGEDAGIPFSINTGGGIIGAFLAGFFIMPLLGLENTTLLASSIYFIIGFAFLLIAKKRSLAVFVPAAAMFAVLVITAYIGKEPSLGYSVYYEGIRYNNASEFIEIKKRIQTLYSRHGHYGLVSVNYDPYTKNIFLLNNGKTDASIHKFDMGNQLMLGHIPLFLHGSPKDVLNIGLGGGFTLGAVTTHPEVSTIDAIEIDPLVFEATEKFFSPYNNNALSDPRVKKHVQDGRHFVETTSKKYDVIISEPPNIWVSGVSQLFTDEFYRAVKKKLKEGGILAQWSPAYELDEKDLKLILATIRQTFEHVMYWTNNVDYIIIASDTKKEPDFARVISLMEVPEVNLDMQRIIKGADAETMMRILMNPTINTDSMPFYLAEQIQINTDNLPHLEFKTARNIYNSRRNRN